MPIAVQLEAQQLHACSGGPHGLVHVWLEAEPDEGRQVQILRDRHVVRVVADHHEVIDVQGESPGEQRRVGVVGVDLALRSEADVVQDDVLVDLLRDEDGVRPAHGDGGAHREPVAGLALQAKLLGRQRRHGEVRAEPVGQRQLMVEVAQVDFGGE